MSIPEITKELKENETLDNRVMWFVECMDSKCPWYSWAESEGEADEFAENHKRHHANGKRYEVRILTKDNSWGAFSIPAENLWEAAAEFRREYAGYWWWNRVTEYTIKEI
jgi:hypothetical protein